MRAIRCAARLGLFIVGRVVRTATPERHTTGVFWIHRRVGSRRAVGTPCRRIVSIGIPVAAVIASSPISLVYDSNLGLGGYP
jgi:hypothetical protein